MNYLVDPESLVQLITGLGITLVVVLLLNKFLSSQVERIVSASPGLTTTYRYTRRLGISIVVLTGVILSAFAAFPTL